MRRFSAVAAILLLMPAGASSQPRAWADEASLSQARAAADLVVVAYIRVATQPRGERGICPVHGHVAQVERGNSKAVGENVRTGIPCGMSPEMYPDMRRIAMRNINSRGWARLYYSGRQLVDYQPLELISIEADNSVTEALPAAR